MNAHAVMQAFVFENNVMLMFPPDVRRYIEQRAAIEKVSPLTIIKERMREVAEFDRLDLERA